MFGFYRSDLKDVPIILFTVNWLNLGHMAVYYCNGSWEMSQAVCPRRSNSLMNSQPFVILNLVTTKIFYKHYLAKTIWAK